MSYVFYLLTTVQLGAFLARRPDLFTVAYFSAAAYFLPAWFPSYPISDGTYIVWSLVLSSIAAAALLADLAKAMAHTPAVSWTLSEGSRSDRLFTSVVTFLCLALFGFILLRTGLSGFLLGKSGVIPGGSIGVYYLWVTLLGFLTLLSYIQNSWFVLTLCVIQYLLLFASGDRTHMTMALVASVLYAFISSGRRSLLGYFCSIRPATFSVFAIVLFLGMFGKLIYAASPILYQRGLAGVFEYANGLSVGLREALYMTEPYHTQSILEYAVGSRVSFDSDYLYKLPLQLLPWSGGLGGDAHVQSQMVKDAFFSDWSDSAGVSSNFWAEGYLLSGYLGVILFCFYYLVVIFLLNIALHRLRGCTLVVTLFMGAYWAFYVQRNSLFQILSHEKRIFYVTILVLLLSLLLSFFYHRPRTRS